MICSNEGIQSDDPKLEIFHNSRYNPILVICTKDKPSMYGFGPQLKKGDVIEIQGTVFSEGKFRVAATKELAFYDYSLFEVKQ